MKQLQLLLFLLLTITSTAQKSNKKNVQKYILITFRL
ncbi:MAG: hypothetical protein ACI9XR_001149 [Flavobacterium sp.]|jgi:hypothetical protein